MEIVNNESLISRTENAFGTFDRPDRKVEQPFDSSALRLFRQCIPIAGGQLLLHQRFGKCI
jgi:hypothetical protein